uniref:Uncharacterized protein n=1 Tax=Ralstonia solanacearum TaxID=305 RepID=A0A0S4TQZ0_RALSL|nr:protein of unknown function [Ralstonia solanacearum]
MPSGRINPVFSQEQDAVTGKHKAAISAPTAQNLHDTTRGKHTGRDIAKPPRGVSVVSPPTAFAA